MFNIFVTGFCATSAAFVEPYFFISDLISIGLLAVELAVRLTSDVGPLVRHVLSAVLLVVSMVFVVAIVLRNAHGGGAEIEGGAQARAAKV
jgi:hypothetical protein